MDSINHLGHRLANNYVFKALATRSVAIINAIVKRIFPRDGAIPMTTDSFHTREGWVSYTPEGHLMPRWYKVTLSSYQNRCGLELNYYSCKSKGIRESISLREVEEKFPQVIQKGNKLKLKATKTFGKSEVTLKTIKISKEELCHSDLIAQGGHKHSPAYGIAWKHFFFGRLFG